MDSLLAGIRTSRVAPYPIRQHQQCSLARGIGRRHRAGIFIALALATWLRTTRKFQDSFLYRIH